MQEKPEIIIGNKVHVWVGVTEAECIAIKCGTITKEIRKKGKTFYGKNAKEKAEKYLNAARAGTAEGVCEQPLTAKAMP